MNNRLNDNLTTPQHTCTPSEVYRVAKRINQIKTHLTQKHGETVLYSDIVKQMGLADLLHSKYIFLWKKILAECINLEMQVHFSNLQKDLAKEESPLCEIILDATCTHSME